MSSITAIAPALYLTLPIENRALFATCTLKIYLTKIFAQGRGRNIAVYIITPTQEPACTTATSGIPSLKAYCLLKKCAAI